MGCDLPLVSGFEKGLQAGASAARSIAGKRGSHIKKIALCCNHDWSIR
jgi:hypothetical protein